MDFLSNSPPWKLFSFNLQHFALSSLQFLNEFLASAPQIRNQRANHINRTTHKGRRLCYTNQFSNTEGQGKFPRLSFDDYSSPS